MLPGDKAHGERGGGEERSRGEDVKEGRGEIVKERRVGEEWRERRRGKGEGEEERRYRRGGIGEEEKRGGGKTRRGDTREGTRKTREMKNLPPLPSPYHGNRKLRVVNVLLLQIRGSP